MTEEFGAPGAAQGGDVTEFFERRGQVDLLEIGHSSDLARIGVLLSGEGEIRQGDGRIRRIDGVALIGPSTRVATVRLWGDVHLFGAVLKPSAWGDLCGESCGRLVDRAIPAAVLLGRSVDDLIEPLRRADSFAERVAIAAAYHAAIRLHRPANGGNAAFAALVERWLVEPGRARIDRLVELSGLSRRQVERQCKLLYGVPPRMLARRHRALRAAGQLAQSATLADVLDGFYDQSHLIRELKHFTGMTPRRIGRGDPGWTHRW